MQLLKMKSIVSLSLSVSVFRREKKDMSRVLFTSLISWSKILFKDSKTNHSVWKIDFFHLGLRFLSDYMKCQLVLCVLSSFANEISPIGCQHHACCVQYSFNDQHNECVAEIHLEWYCENEWSLQTSLFSPLSLWR